MIHNLVVMRDILFVESSQNRNEFDHFESGKPCAASMDLSQRADSTIGWIDELPNAMNQSVQMELLCESFMPKTTIDSCGPQSLVNCKFMLHKQTQTT